MPAQASVKAAATAAFNCARRIQNAASLAGKMPERNQANVAAALSVNPPARANVPDRSRSEYPTKTSAVTSAGPAYDAAAPARTKIDRVTGPIGGLAASAACTSSAAMPASGTMTAQATSAGSERGQSITVSNVNQGISDSTNIKLHT